MRIRVGHLLAVTRVNRVINDPVTGKPLRRIEDRLGILSVTSVDADSAMGEFNGVSPAKVGDRIKRSTTQQNVQRRIEQMTVDRHSLIVICSVLC